MNPWMLPPLAGLALLVGGWSFAIIQYALWRRAERRKVEAGEPAE